jgi:hypothetical protein
MSQRPRRLWILALRPSCSAVALGGQSRGP